MSAMADQAVPGPLPSGTVTFLFTDIEGSTQRWERHRAAMDDAVRRHDALVRAAIAKQRGHVFKTVGDEVCAAFARPEDALAAILDAQRTLAGEDFSAVGGLRLRSAIHTGSANVRDGDYFGTAVNRVARLLAIGHAGQVLVSGVTTDLVQGELPPEASLRDLGEHRLRDLSRPEQVYQLVAPGLAADFPPLRSLDVLPNNLPRMLTSFVGRETEVAQIAELVEKHQLVTIVGSGGVGKTRTSLQVAANLLDGVNDGVWFVELAPLSNGEYIPFTIAQALGVVLPSDGDPLENLVHILKPKHALLVIDNCEHLIESAARVIAAILHASPKIKIIASTRQALGIAGEATYRMPSLMLPDAPDDEALTAAEAAGFASVALFVERAGAADFSFTLTDINAPIVADICRRLDGIPLAIELAAARVKILSPRQLRERLNERFRVLVGGSRDALPRQQTLRALIDWSHALLDERERMLFRRLGIFANGFSLDGAVAIGGAGDIDELDVFDVLASLVEKSLVVVEPTDDGDALRYRLLQSTRMYALQKLSDAKERELLADRHLHYMRDHFVGLRRHAQVTGRRAELIEALAAALEDVRAALDAALNGSDVLAGAELLAAIGRTWEPMGLSNEALTRNEALLSRLPQDEYKLCAQLSATVADLLNHSGRKERAHEVATQAVECARAGGDREALIDALDVYAWNCLSLGRKDDAERAHAESETIPTSSQLLRLQILRTKAFWNDQRGDREAAARIFEHLHKAHRSLGNKREEVVTLLNYAEVEYSEGKTQRAIALAREILAPERRPSEKPLVANVLCNLAGYLAAVDDLEGAVQAGHEVIGIFAAQDPSNYLVTTAIEHLALVAALRGDFERAALLAGYADAAMRQIGFTREFTEKTARGRLTDLLSGGLTPDDLARLTADGTALEPNAAVELALA